jgi:lipid-A-disaccharide synthase-like uncharacterized protein
MELKDFLSWIIAGGGIPFVSWGLERMAWFQKLASQAKEWVFFGFAAGVTVLAYVVQTYVPIEVLQQVAPFFLLISGTFITLFIGKGFHQLDKK